MKALSKAPKLHLINIKLLCQQPLFFTWLSPFLTFILINATPNIIATKFPLPNDILCQRAGLTAQQSSSLYLPIKNSFLTLSKNFFFSFSSFILSMFSSSVCGLLQAILPGLWSIPITFLQLWLCQTQLPFWVTCLPPFLSSSPGVLWDGETPFQCKMSSCSVIFLF